MTPDFVVQNSNATLVLSVLLLMTVVVGCAIFGDNEVILEEADAHLLFGCGISDGGAVGIYIPDEPAQSCSTWESLRHDQPWSQTFTRIYISGSFYSGSDSLEMVFFGSQYNSEQNSLNYTWAGLCVEGEESCIEARAGQILLPSAIRDPFDTRVEILFENGNSFIRELEVFVCEPPRDLFCG